MIFFFFNTGREFIIVMVKYFIKRVLKLNFTSKSPENRKKCGFLITGKYSFGLKFGHFQQKCGQKPYDMVCLGNIHIVYMVPVTFGV